MCLEVMPIGTKSPEAPGARVQLRALLKAAPNCTVCLEDGPGLRVKWYDRALRSRFKEFQCFNVKRATNLLKEN